jgi:molybdopterin/thiamine biosynthesis adenylyltransferase
MSRTVPDNIRIAEAGADVKRLARTRVLVKVDPVPMSSSGGHPLLPFCTAAAAAGIGSVNVFGATHYCEKLASAARARNFELTTGQGPCGRGADATPCADVILDLTNDPQSKRQTYELATDQSIGYASVRWGATWAGVTSGRDAWPTKIRTGDQGTPIQHAVARIAAGLALQEILVFAGQLPLAVLATEALYDAASNPRTDRIGLKPWPDVFIEDARVDVLGAGSVGCHLLECLVPLLGAGCELRVFDPDVVGPENLCLQTAYDEDDLGMPKAQAIAARLAHICNPGVSILPFAMCYEERPRPLCRPALRILCVDNFAARKAANDESVLRDEVPIVEAGSSPLAGQVRSYLPGRTACLECRIPDLAVKAAQETAPASCALNPAPTLPSVNMVLAGVLATEALRCLFPETLGPPSTGTIVYDARVPQRFGVVEVAATCAHGTRRKLCAGR